MEAKVKITETNLDRRGFLRAAGFSAAWLAFTSKAWPLSANRSLPKPNVLFVLVDQWRAQATGYAGDVNAITPNLDKLAAQSVNFTNAVSGCSVCCPYRASLITGQYPLTHGVFINDVALDPEADSIAKVYNKAGYETGFIGKWHIDGQGRSSFIPPARRQGFKFWRVLECTHNYNKSYYYGDENIKLLWDGYDAIAQTKEAIKYIRTNAGAKPFTLFLSWGPPHAPYHTAPEKYQAMYENKDIKLRPNIPAENKEAAIKDLKGYYAHIAALDDCLGRLVETLEQQGIADNTILIFTSDHGDMLYSQGQNKKQKPWEESILVPLLIRYPALLGTSERKIDMPINTPDIMPTLLSLCGLDSPKSVEGNDYSGVVKGDQRPENDAVLISCPSPFGQWRRDLHGGKEYRGVRTRRYTYVRDLNGPWLLYDNKTDPYQLNNLCGKKQYSQLQRQLEQQLKKLLKETNDDFLPGPEYIKQWGYAVDESGTMPYQK